MPGCRGPCDLNDKHEIDVLAHRLFLLTLAAKGALGIIQIATAAALALGMADKLPGLAQRIFAAELSQDPTDFIATRLLALAGHVPNSDLTFYTVYFAAHGVLHVGVVALLLFGHAWAYPAAIAVLAGFVVYQMFEWLSVGGTMLLLLSAIDLAVIFLTIREWSARSPSRH